MIKQLYFTFIFISLFTIVLAQPHDYTSIDEHARNVPSSLTNNLSSLTDYLTKPTINDFEKVRSIYMWLAVNVSYDVKAYVKNNNEYCTPEQILKRKKALCNGYATLFKAMCDKAAVKCYVINGYAKGFDYKQGDSFIKTNHTWNVVYIENNWYLIDATWASGYLSLKNRTCRQFLFNHFRIPYINNKVTFIKNINSNYFLQNPKTFICTHLPANPMWQLLDCPISIDIFEKETLVITDEIKSLSSNRCFNFKDSISAYELYPSPDNILTSGKDAHAFNTRNNHVIAQAYYDYSEELTAAAINSTLALEDKIKKCEEAASCYNKAKDYFDEHKKDINNENKLNEDSNKGKNKLLIKENDSYIKSNDRLRNRNGRYMQKDKDENKKLHIENKKISQENRKLVNDDIENVKRLQKEAREKEKILLEQNLKAIKDNKELIKTNKIENKNLRRDIRQENEMFINKNFKSIIESHNQSKELINQNILLRIKNDNHSDSLIIINKNKIKQNKEENAELRKLNKEESEIYIKENIKLIKEKYKQNKKLIKLNKKFIKKNKRLSIEDMQENQQYIEENKTFIEENNSFIDGNTALIKDNYSEIKNLKGENNILKKENKLLKLENKIEQHRYKYNNKIINRKFTTDLKRNTNDIAKCKERSKYVKSKIAELKK